MPGPSGQKMEEAILDKIARLHRSCPQCIIGVDGGINVEVASQTVQAGARIVVARSVIFNAPRVEEAIRALQSVLDVL